MGGRQLVDIALETECHLCTCIGCNLICELSRSHVHPLQDSRLRLAGHLLVSFWSPSGELKSFILHLPGLWQLAKCCLSPSLVKCQPLLLWLLDHCSPIPHALALSTFSFYSLESGAPRWTEPGALVSLLPEVTCSLGFMAKQGCNENTARCLSRSWICEKRSKSKVGGGWCSWPSNWDPQPDLQIQQFELDPSPFLLLLLHSRKALLVMWGAANSLRSSELCALIALESVRDWINSHEISCLYRGGGCSLIRIVMGQLEYLRQWKGK